MRNLQLIKHSQGQLDIQNSRISFFSIDCENGILYCITDVAKMIATSLSDGKVVDLNNFLSIIEFY